MLDKVKVFGNDYAELLHGHGEFYKKHWKGVILTQVAIYGVVIVGAVGTLAVVGGANKLKDKLSKKENDLEEEVDYVKSIDDTLAEMQCNIDRVLRS